MRKLRASIDCNGGGSCCQDRNKLPEKKNQRNHNRITKNEEADNK